MAGVGSAYRHFVLPFSTVSENRKEPFTADLEAATVFSLAEIGRTKGSGLISKHPEEKLAFIAKIGYPLWLFPWSEATFVFDGLHRSNYTLRYAVIPDVNTFIEDLKSGSKTRETYLAFLSDSITYFQTPVTEKSVVVNGLITDPDFLAEFESHRHEAIEIEDEIASVELLSPIIEESTISAIFKELEYLHSSFKREVEKLYKCMKFLNRATRHYSHSLRHKAHTLKEEFNVKITAQEELISPKVFHLKEDYDHKIIKSSRTFESQHLHLQKTKVKLEKALEGALANIEHCKMEAKTCEEKDDSVGEKKWKEKSRNTKKELSEIEDRLKDTEKKLTELEEQKSLEIFNLRSELEAKIKEFRQPLQDLESSRDAEVILYKEEIDKLEQNTQLILNQLDRIIKLREANIANFAKIGVKKGSERREVMLFYVPFYAICYESESKKRYFFLPPSEANTIGFSTKLKSALGKAKIKQLLVPRFYAMLSLTDNLQVLAQESTVFETELKELGENANILNKNSLLERVKKGLGSIRTEGWISEKEHQALSQKIP
jgi:hypothetical protein